jgi:hypothetical protein
MFRLLLLLIFIGLSGSAHAFVKHVVMDLDGIIVQGGPEKNMRDFSDKSRVFEVNHDRKYFFVTYPGAREFLNKLTQSPNVIIHFTYFGDPELGQRILDAAKLREHLGSVGHLYTRDDLSGGSFDLRKVSSDVDNVLYVSANGVRAVQTAMEVNFEAKYYFESFAEAKREYQLSNPRQRGPIPQSEEEWRQSTYRWAVISELIFASGLLKSKNAKISVKAFKEEREALLLAGIPKIQQKFKAIYYKLTFQNDSSVCQKFNTETNSLMGTADHEVCKAQINYFYVWKSKAKTTCVSATEDLRLIKEEDPNRCQTEDYLLYSSTSKKWQRITVGILPSTVVDFSKYNLALERKDNQILPRNYATMYRSMGESQLSVAQALRMLFRDHQVVIESKIVTALKHRLMGRPSPVTSDLDKFGHGALADDAVRNNGGPFSPNEAVAEAIRISEFKINSARPGTIHKTYIDYNSPTYIDFPDSSLYFSTYFGVSAMYSNKMIVVRDRLNRSADLTHINNRLHTQWDAGEFLFPLYLSTSEMDGYHMMTGGEGWDENRTTNEAFYNVHDSGNEYILVYKGYNCLFKGNDDRIYTCPAKKITQYGILDPIPSIATGERAKAFAVLALCSKELPCDLPKGFFARHNVETQARALELDLRQISGGPVKINNQIPKAFYKEETIPAKQMTTTLDVPSDELKNAEFNGITNWGVVGEQLYPLNANGNSCVSSWDIGGRGDLAQGALYQDINVGPRSRSIKFRLTGGHISVKLWSDGAIVFEARGPESNEVMKDFDWDLRPLRGKIVRFAIDDTYSDGWGWGTVCNLQSIMMN